MKTAILTGQLPAALANCVSDVIRAALTKGMQPDEAVSIVLRVAADHGREAYGDGYLDQLSELIKTFRGDAQ
jgi:hypothetical protein